MTQLVQLPLTATVKAAYGDVFGNLFAFLRVIWLVLLMMVLFVEIPSLITQQEIYFSIHPERRSEDASSAASSKIDLPATEKAATEDKKTPEQAQQEQTLKEAGKVHPEHVMLLMGLSLLQIILIFSYSVAWYRQLLFNDKKDKTIVFQFGKAEWHFSVTAMKAGFVLAPIVLVLMSYYMASMPGFTEGEPIKIEDYWPLFLGGAILMLYLIARLSMSYPLTMVGQWAEPIKQSWNMTKQHVWSIMLGFIWMCLPATLFTGLTAGLAGVAFNMISELIGGEAAASNLQATFAANVVYKAIGSTYMLFVFALVSAFYARTYAFFVRTEQAPAKP